MRKKEQTGRTGKAGNFRWYPTLMGILLLWLCSFGNAAAQTTSKLELVDPSGNHVEVQKVTNLPVSATNVGDRVFNTTTNHVMQWTGLNWHMEWSLTPITGVVEIPSPASCPYLPVRFMKYNLGADPSIDTPKKQIEYLVTTNYGQKYPADDARGENWRWTYVRKVDARVVGGLYQWGRKDTLHGAGYNDSPIHEQLRYVRYTQTTGTTSTTATDTPVDGTFYTVGGNWYNGANPTSLWGNGSDGEETPNSGVLYNDKYYQSPVKTDNDPCPPGFRVPTQDEWERLLGYDFNSSSMLSSSLLDFGNARYVDNGNGLTWVRVACNGNYLADPAPIVNVGRAATSIAGGVAIYKSEVWHDPANADYKNGTKVLYEEAAPEPLLFLPAGGLRLNMDGGEPAGDISGSWTWVHYWSSTTRGGKPFYLCIGDATDSATKQEIRIHTSSSQSARGLSIRCVYE
ncbi:MAG: hypothetical protein LBS46_07805 [Dysgonamonadaceae bacterium]|nr:hypothetical protein [Dysgonamonadaceae bacterium]